MYLVSTTYSIFGNSVDTQVKILLYFKIVRFISTFSPFFMSIFERVSKVEQHAYDNHVIFQNLY